MKFYNDNFFNQAQNHILVKEKKQKVKNLALQGLKT